MSGVDDTDELVIANLAKREAGEQKQEPAMQPAPLSKLGTTVAGAPPKPPKQRAPVNETPAVGPPAEEVTEVAEAVEPQVKTKQHEGRKFSKTVEAMAVLAEKQESSQLRNLEGRQQISLRVTETVDGLLTKHAMSKDVFYGQRTELALRWLLSIPENKPKAVLELFEEFEDLLQMQVRRGDPGWEQKSLAAVQMPEVARNHAEAVSKAIYESTCDSAGIGGEVVSYNKVILLALIVGVSYAVQK